MASSSVRNDVKYHKLGEEGEGRSASSLSRNRRNSVSGSRNFTSRRRLLPKVVAVALVFCILLFFQFGSHLFRTLSTYDDDEPAIIFTTDENILDKMVIPVKQPEDEETPEGGSLKPQGEEQKYQLNLDHCKIPKLQSKSQNYQLYEADIVKMESCKTEDEEFAILNDGILSLNKRFDRENCCVHEIQRPKELPSDTNAFLAGECQKFDQSNKFDMQNLEFVYIACSESSDSKPTHFSFQANVLASKWKAKIEYWKAKPKPPNIVVLVLDSVSKTDGYRNLPKTMDYLLNELEFVDYNGYHALGEPTMRNVLPMLLGINLTTFFEKRSWDDPWDSVPFIWKQFANQQYLTSYIEDIPQHGTFNYGGQAGFMQQPTDFYMRQFFTAHANVTTKNITDKLLKYCIGQKSIEEVLFDVTSEIIGKANPIVPFFLVPWPCWPQHDYFDTLFHLDNTVLNFFRKIGDANEVLENTVLLLMGDHGFYSSRYASTHEGLLERRNPMFLIRLPRSLTDAHPDFLKNIQGNANRITSHYDLHSTLQHLSQLVEDSQPFSPHASVNIYGKSLLQAIPETRTCEEAGIPVAMCACNLPSPDTSAQQQQTVPKEVQLPIEPFHIEMRNHNGSAQTSLYHTNLLKTPPLSVSV